MSFVAAVEGGGRRGLVGVSWTGGRVEVRFRRSRLAERSFFGEDGLVAEDGVIRTLLNARPSSWMKLFVAEVSSSSVMNRL